MSRGLGIVACVVVALGCACSPGDALALVQDPSPGHIFFCLLVAPIFWVAERFLVDLLVALVPRRLKTRRAVWTMTVVAVVTTVGAVAYWDQAGRH